MLWQELAKHVHIVLADCYSAFAIWPEAKPFMAFVLPEAMNTGACQLATWPRADQINMLLGA